MAANEVAVVNMALSRMRVSTRISGTTVAGLAGTTLAEQQASVWYAACRQRVIRDYPWQFAKRYATLTMVELFDDTDEEFGRWTYSYRYPTGALLVREVYFPGQKRKSVPPNEFEISMDVTGRLLLCDVGTSDTGGALVEYMIDVTDTTLFDPKFESALAWLLASELANTLPADGNIRKETFANYVMEIASAQAADANEQEQGPDPDGPSVRSREGA